MSEALFNKPQAAQVDFSPAAFLAELRAAQAARGKPLKGPLSLLPEQFQHAASASDAALRLSPQFNGASLTVPLRKLLERTLEMARRNQINVHPDKLEVIAQILLIELTANITAFGAERKPETIIPITLHQGSTCARMSQETEFKAFSDTPGIFKDAAVNYPSDPRQFLRGVMNTMAALASEKEFKAFADTPGIFKHAAVHYPSEPRQFLRGVMNMIAALASEKEFKAFADTPGIFKDAAVHYPSDPRQFLRGVMNTMVALASEKEFKAFADTPGIFKYAAVHYPSDPRQFLRGVMNTMAALASEKEFKAFADTPGIFKYAAVSYPSDPRQFLRGVMSGEIIDYRWRRPDPQVFSGEESPLILAAK
jgi:uncharacterized Zn finger protein